MTTGTVVGAAMVAVGALVWALGTAVLARANPAERIPRRGDEGWWRYRGSYLVSLVLGLLGSFQLRDEHGWWAFAVGFAVWFVPQQVVSAAHGRRVRRRAAHG